jgi:hypothetical protein
LNLEIGDCKTRILLSGLVTIVTHFFKQKVHQRKVYERMGLPCMPSFITLNRSAVVTYGLQKQIAQFPIVYVPFPCVTMELSLYL